MAHSSFVPPGPNPPGRDRLRLSTGALVSLLFHGILALLLVLAVESPRETESRREAVRLRILDSAQSAAKTGRKSDPQRALEGQIVDLPKPAVEKVPDTARFLSQWNTSVERETKAKRNPTGRTGHAGSPRGVQKPSPGAAQTGASMEVALPMAPSVPPTASDGSTPSNRPGKGIKGLAGFDQLLVPTLGGGRGAARRTGVPGGGEPLGGMVSADAFLGVPEEGDQNLVNSRSFKFWDFFERVKGRVRDEWTPGALYDARDPNGKVYGNRDRLTVLSVILDEKGAVSRLQIVRESGLAFLDEEAIRAFKQAGPFPNPPAGLVDGNGHIEFTFGFLLEVGASKGRFGW